MKGTPVLSLPAPRVASDVQGSELAVVRGMLAELRVLASDGGRQRVKPVRMLAERDNAGLPVRRRFVDRARDAID